MMDVRIVGVSTQQRFVRELAAVPRIVSVLTVFVVNVRARMFEIAVHVLMGVVFSDVRPHPTSAAIGVAVEAPTQRASRSPHLQ